MLVLGACATATGTSTDAPNPRAVQPERPTVATHAGTVAPGYAELETGVERDQPGDGTLAVSVPSVLKIGLAPRAQLSLGAPLTGSTGTPFGLGDVSVGVKWRVLDDRPLLRDVAVLPSVKLSTGGDRGTGTTDVGLLLISSHDWGDYALDLNAGYTHRSGDGSQAPKDATLWTVSAGGPVYESLGWVAEVFGFPGTTGPAGNRGTAAFLTGPTFTVAKWLVLDAGGIIPLTGPQPRAFYAGLTWNIGKL